MTAFYNEIDTEKAAWLRELIKAEVIAPGIVDERSITELYPEELRQYTQCHFFAGIGVWSYALRLAGWPDDRPVWTGSCPCPSFSCAGKGEGFDDPRHLWPDWERLIRVRKPSVIFGEQSDDAIGYGWLDLVQTQLEAQDYAVGKAVLASASVGGADIRQRLYFVADANSQSREQLTGAVFGAQAEGGSEGFDDGDMRKRHPVCGATGLLADPELERLEQFTDASRESDGILVASVEPSQRLQPTSGHGASTGELAYPERERGCSGTAGSGDAGDVGEPMQTGILRGFWRDAEWIPCRHPKVPGAIEWRPIKPGTFCLAHGAAARVLSLRGFGDAINSQVAKAFIESYQDCHRRVD